jgi:methylenetetrahydrofolate dehydrogenase (NADP+)/methenyltetrahydrofolate cyclohydrolase
MEIIDGKQIANEILSSLQVPTSTRLNIVLAGNDPASEIYAALKKKKAQELGIECLLIKKDEGVTKEELMDTLKSLEGGTILQLPLYPHLEESRFEILDAINPEFDVDGLTSTSRGGLGTSKQRFVPATAAAVLECIRFTTEEPLHHYLRGQHVVIINHSHLIGRPLAQLLLTHNATVTVCHKFTENLAEVTKQADILVTAAGTPALVTSDMVKEGSTLIDVTSMKVDGKVVGDVKVDEDLQNKIAWLSPVPGGVGPVTIACLLRNLML